MSVFQKHSILKTPHGKKILLLQEATPSSSWLALILPAAPVSATLPAGYEKCLVARRYLRRCEFVEQIKIVGEHKLLNA